MLARLAEAEWSPRRLTMRLASLRKLLYFVNSLSANEKRWLQDAVEDPDTLFTRERILLLNKLVKRNLVVDDIPPRSAVLWIGTHTTREGRRLQNRKVCRMVNTSPLGSSENSFKSIHNIFTGQKENHNLDEYDGYSYTYVSKKRAIDHSPLSSKPRNQEAPRPSANLFGGRQKLHREESCPSL
jgi:hypothetical protein